MDKLPHKPETHPDPLITTEDVVPLRADRIKPDQVPARRKDPAVDKAVATALAAIKKPDQPQSPLTSGTKATSSPAWCANWNIRLS